MGNYLFFEPRHCQIKLQDMLHNMLDMKEMEIKTRLFRKTSCQGIFTWGSTKKARYVA